MRDLDYQVEKRIENMSEEEFSMARSMYNEQVENEETNHNNFIDWLWDYTYSYLFESGND